MRRYDEPGPVEVWHDRLNRWVPATYGQHPNKVFVRAKRATLCACRKRRAR